MVLVDLIEIGEDDVDVELQLLCIWFGILIVVDWLVVVGDVVLIDLFVMVDGEDILNVVVEGFFYEVGFGWFIVGFDDVVVGLFVDEFWVFIVKLVVGEYVGQEVQVIVMVRLVKECELLEFDDEFVQLVSEFDSIDELWVSFSDQVCQVKCVQQVEQI